MAKRLRDPQGLSGANAQPREALRGAARGPQEGLQKPRAARSCGHAAQGFQGERRVGGTVWEKSLRTEP